MTSATFDSMSSRRSFKSGTLKNQRIPRSYSKALDSDYGCMDGGPNEQDALTGDTLTVNCISFFQVRSLFSCVEIHVLLCGVHTLIF